MAERWQQWMPHQIDAWQGSANVQALSDLAYRAVHNLILEMWKQNDCALPSEDRELAKRSRVAARWTECRDEVLEYFTDRTPDGKITHRVTLQKWHEAREVYMKRQKAAQRTNALRSGDGHRHGDRDAPPTHEQEQEQEHYKNSTEQSISKSRAEAPHKENISVLVAQIAVAFPKSRLASLSLTDVRPEATVAVLQAVDAEVERVGVTRTQAAEMILDRMELLAKEVPRDQWKFFQKLPEFMRNREYRKEPEEFKNGTPKQDQPRTSPAEQRRRDNLTGLASVAARRYGIGPLADDGASASAVSQSGTPGTDAGDVSGGVGGAGVEVRPSPVQGCVIEGRQ